MATVEKQVQAASSAIDENIDSLRNNPELLSRNVLAQIRPLLEGLMVWAATGDPQREFHYENVGPAREKVSGLANLRLLDRIHKMVQASTSHYSLERDPSDRLMLKYYEYLVRTRDLAKQQLGLEILQNLEHFPLDADPALDAYYEKIAERIDIAKNRPLTERVERYYINSTRPFFVGDRIYYEVTFSLAHNRTSKFDRIIGFTDIDITDHYAANLELTNDSIAVLGQTLPIVLIRDWSVSIRPCELDNFARLFGIPMRMQSRNVAYRNLMSYLTHTRHNLLDIIDSSPRKYGQIKSEIALNARQKRSIFSMLDSAREIIQHKEPGTRLLRYLLLKMNNQILKDQYYVVQCEWLSNLYVSSGCRPFDTMPFCTSPRKHNPRIAELAASIDASGREHEFLARRVRNNVERNGNIYTPDSELDDLGDIDELIRRHNAALPPTDRHKPRKLRHVNGHVFITGYEDDTVQIIKALQARATHGFADYTEKVDAWLTLNAELPDGDTQKVDDDRKKDALRKLFAHSRVAVIYGAAGTGKSMMVNHIANFFESARKLFLAHTNPAVDNLKRRVQAPNAHFNTITKHIKGDQKTSGHFGVVVIDECSTVSNAGFLKVLEETSFDLLVLVGDVYQIESIEFGNWFSSIRSYIRTESVHELTHPYRTTDKELLTLWDRVRSLDDRIEESLSRSGYSVELGESLFKQHGADEIVLCLNYDGLYGINNVNRFLQASNPNRSYTWGEAVFKIGDPVLFSENAQGFRPVIFNNMKGTIVGIDKARGRITFDVDIGRKVTPRDVRPTDLRLVEGSVVQFDVFERDDPDADDEPVNTIVPFQIAYAVSIHKAQGLEFDSVKIVITDANEDDISHSIFYTAITRARTHLAIYWTAQTQQRILERLEVRQNTKDNVLLQKRRGVETVAKVKSRQKSRKRP